MRKVLIVTYWYPPKRTIGALRPAKWAKYLPEFGWEPIVVTVEPHSDLYTRHGTLADELRQGRVYRTRDLSLNELLYATRALSPVRKFARALSSAPENNPEGRLKSRNPLGRLGHLAYWVYKQFICFPDEAVPWLLEYPRIERIAREERPEVILSSSLPNTSHLIASLLSRRLAIPWVADFRDLWSQNHVLPRNVLLRWIEVILEKKTVEPAAGLITVSEPLKCQLEQLHGKPTYVIPNGFDPEDFPNEPPPSDPSRPLRIVYTGSVYPVHRDPRPLFAALQMMLKEGKIRSGDVQIDFYGRRLNVVWSLLESYPDVRPMVRLKGEVPYEEALKAQVSADVLLLLEWTDPKAKGVYTGKVFEYLGAKRPILSVGPAEGVIAELLRETKAGVHVQRAEEILPWLSRWLDEKRAFGRPRWLGDPEVVGRYSRREQARYLAEVLSSVAKGAFST